MNVMSNPSTTATLGAIIDRATQIGGIKGTLMAGQARAAIKAKTEGEKIAHQEAMLHSVHATGCNELKGYVRAIQDDLIVAGYYRLPEAVRAAF